MPAWPRSRNWPRRRRRTGWRQQRRWKRHPDTAISSLAPHRPANQPPNRLLWRAEGGMIYMVQMALLDAARRAEWDAWYVAHQHRLLAIPGIHASQRFECIHIAAAPFVA